MPSFMAFSVSVDSCSPNRPVNEAESAVNTVSLVEKKRHRLLVDALLGVGRLHQPRHDDLGGRVGDRQVVARGPWRSGSAAPRSAGRAASRRASISSCARSAGVPSVKPASASAAACRPPSCASSCLVADVEHFERHHLGLLQRAAEVAIGLEDRVLAVDLVLGLLGDVEIGVADLVEARWRCRRARPSSRRWRRAPSGRACRRRAGRPCPWRRRGSS